MIASNLPTEDRRVHTGVVCLSLQMLSLRHPNIVQLFGGAWTLEDIHVSIVLDQASHSGRTGWCQATLTQEPSELDSWRRGRPRHPGQCAWPPGSLP